MLKDELVAEISMRRDIPLEDVEEVLDEQEIILCAEAKAKKRKRNICIFGTIAIFVAGMVAALAILNKKQKINLEELVATIKQNLKDKCEKCCD
ncbi:MAG: hypothetical protein Q4D54_03235 [Eubacteriales bacterium]|nr:hypothetical protein [Lachnospiraceae bacterium]MDO5126746.1 hypothetical protein [Eubacteriales bacterium]